MGWTELFLIALGLSMDAFAVAVCKGLAGSEVGLGHAVVIGLYFGAFQAAMPLIGYLAGAQFADYISAYDHWIAFALLAIIGGKMVKESFDKSCPEDAGDASVAPSVMLWLAVATSIDALAVGVSFAFLSVQIVPAIAVIGVTTFVLSIAGVGIGRAFGSAIKSKAELVGGLVLVGIGIKILLEHTGIL